MKDLLQYQYTRLTPVCVVYKFNDTLTVVMCAHDAVLSGAGIVSSAFTARSLHTLVLTVLLLLLPLHSLSKEAR